MGDDVSDDAKRMMFRATTFGLGIIAIAIGLWGYIIGGLYSALVFGVSLLVMAELAMWLHRRAARQSGVGREIE